MEEDNDNPIHKCVFCNQHFSDKESLQIHFRKHGDPSFKQEPKGSIVKSEDADNKSTSSTSSMVSCDVCDELFPTISKAITHKHKFHPYHDVKYFCNWCGKLFTLKHLFNKHLMNHDNMDTSYVFHCDPCDVDFYVPSAMMYHNRCFHRQDTEIPEIGISRKQVSINQERLTLYYCPFCGEEYNNKVNIYKHVNDDHAEENQSPTDVLRCPRCDAIFYHLDAYEIHLTFHSSQDLFADNREPSDIKEYTLDTVPPIPESVVGPDETEFDIAALLGGTTEEAPGVSDTERKKKKKKSKKSKKETITLDEFLNMNKDVFGEEVSVHGIEEVPTPVVAKKLKRASKPQVATPKTLTKVSKADIEKLKNCGISIVKKNNAINQGVKVLKKVSKLPNEVVQPVRTENKPSTSCNTEALNKLLSNSQTQLKITKSAGKPETKEQETEDLMPNDPMEKTESDLMDVDFEKELDTLLTTNEADVSKEDILKTNLVQTATSSNKSLDIFKNLSQNITIKSNNEKKSEPNQISFLEVKETQESAAKPIEKLKILGHLTVKSSKNENIQNDKNKIVEKTKTEINFIAPNQAAVPETNFENETLNLMSDPKANNSAIINQEVSKNLTETIKKLSGNITVKSSSSNKVNAPNEAEKASTKSKVQTDNSNLEILKKLSAQINVKGPKESKRIVESSDEYDMDSHEEEQEQAIIKPVQYQSNVVQSSVEPKNKVVLNMSQNLPTNIKGFEKDFLSKMNPGISIKSSLSKSSVDTEKTVVNPLTAEDEVFSVDDSDSDEIDADTIAKIQRHQQQVALAKMKNSNNINNTKIMHKPLQIKKEIENTQEHHYDSFEDTEDDEPLTNITKVSKLKPPQNTNIPEFLKNNRNLTIKNKSEAYYNDNNSNHSDDCSNERNNDKTKESNKAIKNTLINSFKEFDTDDDMTGEMPMTDSDDEMDPVMNKLKSLNQDGLIKMTKTSSNNESIKTSNVIKRPLNMPNKIPIKQIKVAPHCSKNIQNQIRPNQSQIATKQNHPNVINKQTTTTNVQTIQTKTVVEEITTTVTRTIKTIDQSTNSTVETVQSKTSTNNITTGTMPMIGSSIKPAKPFVGPRSRQPNFIRPPLPIKAPGCQTPNRPGMSRPSTSQRMPMKIRGAAPQLVRGMPNSKHINSMSDEGTQVKRVMNMSQSFKSDSATGTVEMKKQSSSQEQITKLNKISGLQIVKSSQTKVQSCEISSTNKNALDAIERLQRQGLLIRKPQIAEPESDEWSDEDHDGSLLAIEGGSS